MNNTQAQLPQYQCHKKVWALKIKAVQLHDPTGSNPPVEFAGGFLMPEDSRFNPIAFDADFYRKHEPVDGCYWVQYEDGYTSISPASAFESGYSLVDHRLANVLHGNDKRKTMLWRRDRGMDSGHDPLSFEDLMRLYGPYLEAFSHENLEVREVRLLETLLSK
ncbi:hypothetical protein [Prosthecobacter sp.]|uniref:hypothetical protein n=1 Tax=Prosthecobacter sp. TaxID=1965333 RepID=UPI0037831716